jgi:hypothetical protein
VAAALVALGLIVLVVAGVDVVWTVLAAGSGAGPLTARLSTVAWRVALALGRREGGTHHALLAVFGMVIVVGMLVSWVVVASGAWLLIAAAYDGAVRVAESGEPADLMQRAAFVGVNLFTLGSSEVVGGDGLWQFLPTAIAASGVIALTLGIGYIVPVASAVAERRQLAQYVLSLGPTPERVLTNAWTGSDFGALGQHLVALMPMLHLAGEHQLTYPAIAYFHSGREEASSSLSIAVLDDAVTLLRHGVAADVRPDPATVDAMARTAGAFLDTVGTEALAAGVEPLPPPDLEPLRAAGIPTVSDADFDAAIAGDGQRRRQLAGLLAHDGWTGGAWERRRRSLAG